MWCVCLDNTSATQINKIRCHPTLPIAVTAHEDKYLRFYDLTSGAVTHSMVAHGDAVSGIAIDPNGLYLLSSSTHVSILVRAAPIIVLVSVLHLYYHFWWY